MKGERGGRVSAALVVFRAVLVGHLEVSFFFEEEQEATRPSGQPWKAYYVGTDVYSTCVCLPYIHHLGV